jgi:DNA polymerase-1
MTFQPSLFPVVTKNTEWRPPELPDLSAYKELGYDLETTGLKWWAGDRPVGAAVAAPDGRSWYFPTGHKQGPNIDPDKFRAWARSPQGLAGKTLVGANSKFDGNMSHAWGLDLESIGCRLSDIAHDAALLDDHRKEFTLESIAQDYVGSGKLKTAGGDPIEITRVGEYHAGDVEAYARHDAVLVLKVRAKTMPAMADEDLLRVKELEDRVIFPVMSMERGGFPINEELLDDFIKRCRQEYLRCLWRIRKLTGITIDPGKVDDMERLFHHCRVPVIDYTPSGKPSFTDDILANCSHEAIVLARRAKKLDSLDNKFLSKYKENLLDGHIFYALHQLKVVHEGADAGTVTGRFSSSAFRSRDQGWSFGINKQQVPSVEKQIEQMGDDYVVRQLFTATCGRSGCRRCAGGEKQKVAAADAKQIEYRVFAHYANSRQLNKAYADDPEADFHNTVGEMIRPFRPGLIRKYVKNTNFCKLFGGGPDKIASMLGITPDEAREFVAIYDRAFPEVKAMLNQAMDTARKRGYVKTILGRRSRFPTHDRIYKALNGVVQGTATGDIMKIKTCEVYESRRETGARLRSVVHDEAVMTVPDQESADKVAVILNKQSIKLRIPILWDMSTGDNWRECA